MDDIVKFYESYDEEGRLFRDKAHMVEYLVTTRYFDRLFEPGSRILDACAGAGRYSFYLADKGCTVTACDLSVRVCKSGGIVVFTYLSINQSEYIEHNRQLKQHPSGIFSSSAPCQIEGMAIKFGLEKMHHISTRSSSHFEDNINDLSDDNFIKYMEYRYITCEDEGAAGDLALWIGKKQNHENLNLVCHYGL